VMRPWGPCRIGGRAPDSCVTVRNLGQAVRASGCSPVYAFLGIGVPVIIASSLQALPCAHTWWASRASTDASARRGMGMTAGRRARIQLRSPRAHLRGLRTPWCHHRHRHLAPSSGRWLGDVIDAGINISIGSFSWAR